MDTLFSGVRFVLIGFDSVSEAQYRSEVVNAGGVDVGRYDASCTHVIVHDRVYDDPVCVAARDDGKTLVTDLWVEASLDVGSLVNARRVLYQPVKDLNGISGADSLCVCLTGYQKPQRDDIMKMVDLMGAQFSKPLIAAKVTHLVCYKFEGEKYELAKRTKMKLVNHRWLEDCLKFWDVLPVDSYNKSGWEIELMEAQASDSETETEMDISVIPKLQNGFTSGSSNSRKSLGELYKTDQDASMADIPLCNADEHGNHWELHDSGQQNKANEVDMMIESVGRNKLERYPGSGPKSSTSMAPDVVGRTDSRAEELNGISNEVIFSERSADADKEANKLSPDVSGDRIFSNSKNSDAESPPFSRRAYDSLSNGHMVDSNKRNNTGKFKYLNSGNEGQIGGNNTIKEAIVKEVLTPIGKYGGGSSISLKNNKRPSYFEVSNGRNGSPNISKKSMKVSPEISSALLKRPSPGISGPRSVEGTNETSILTGSPSDENFGSFKPQALYASSGVQEDLLQKSTLTDDGKMHGLAMSPTSLKPVERTGEAPFRSVRSFESENPQIIIDAPHISCQQNSSSSIEKTSTALITDQKDDIPKVKCVTLKKPLKQGRTVLVARSASISKETEEDINKKKSPDLFLEEHIRVKFTICNESAGTMKTQSNAISDEVGTLPQSVAEGKTSLPRNKCDVAPDFLDQGGVDALVPSGAVRKKCYAKKSTNTRCKLFRSELPKHEENTSVTNEAGLEAGKELEESRIGKIVDIKKAEKPALTKVKGRKPRSNASALEEADKENRPTGSGNTILKTDQESIQKPVLSSSNLSSKTKSPSLKIAKPEPSCFILSGHRLQRKEFQRFVRRLKGKVCGDTHQWSYEATHLIVPHPVRTEKFFAATAAGRWVLKSDYLAASNQAGRFLQEDAYEWFKKGLNEDGAINMEAPRKWRLLRERTGHGALHGMRIILYGECIAPPLDTLKRAVKAGDGVILATSPPYTRFLMSSVDYAIVSASISRSDYWIQEFLKHEIPCVVTDYLVDYVCKSGYPLDRHVLYGTHSWAERSMQNLVSRSEEVVETSESPDKAEDDSKDGNDANDVACLVCGSRDREEVMLICGDETGALGCGAGSHIDCCNPPYDAVPAEDWFCPQCSIGNCFGSKSCKMSGKEGRGKPSFKS